MLVVQPEKNHRRLVLRAVDNLAAMSISLLGVVVNGVNGSQQGGYGGYGYGYGYGYGDGYGADEEATDAAEMSPLPATSTPRRRAA